MTLSQALKDYVATNPTSPAVALNVSGSETEFSRAQLANSVYKFAQQFFEQGIGYRDAVVLSHPTSFEFVSAFWALQLLGATVVPIPQFEKSKSNNEAIKTLERIEHIVAAKAIVVDQNGSDSLKRTKLAEKTINIAPHKAAHREETGLEEFAALAAESKSCPDDIAVIQFTSGSTSDPKGCCISHQAFRDNAAAIKQRIDAASGDWMVCWLPLFHDMGLMTGVVGPVLMNLSSHLQTTKAFGVKPLSWVKNLTRDQQTHTAVPNYALSLVAQIVERRGLEQVDLSGVKTIVVGAEMIDPRSVERFLDCLEPYGLNRLAIQPAYGMAEATLMVTSNPGGGRNDAFAGREYVCVGTCIPGAGVRIVNQEPRGERLIGRILVKSPSLMQGYFKNIEATEKAIDDGWLDTGDLGYLVGSFLYITGRANDTIIVAGRNIEPFDIETRVAECLSVDVSKIAALGIFNQLGTMDICILVERLKRIDENLIKREASRACVEACGLQPKSVVVLDQKFPRTTSGKVQKSKLRKLQIA